MFNPIPSYTGSDDVVLFVSEGVVVNIVTAAIQFVTVGPVTDQVIVVWSA